MKLFAIISRFYSAITERNFIATISLKARSHIEGHVSCRGKIQLSVNKEASVRLLGNTSIGVRLLAESTVKTAVTVFAAGSESTVVLDGALIGRGCLITAGPSARMMIGKGTYITDGTRIAADHSISIGCDCAISWGVTIIDNDGHGFGDPPYAAAVTIEDRVWIGCNAIILKGVSLGAGSVVAAGAVVTRSCPPNSLLAGVPARIIRADVHWTDAKRLEAQEGRL